MDLAKGIRKHGFRKWYERELMQSHLHMLLLVFCAIGLLGGFEVFSRQAAPIDQLSIGASIVACFGIGIWSMRRYLFLLLHAEQVANQAVCAQCKAYGRLEVTRDEPRLQRVGVRCTRCGHGWPIDA
jgi:hypothetical protein